MVVHSGGLEVFWRHNVSESEGNRVPGQAGAPSCLVAPLFPLPDVCLFPGTVLPLHVFEPRYRQMVEDQLDRAGRIVMGNVPADAQADLAGSPAVHGVAGLGEIAQHRRQPDGRFLLWLVGLCRVKIHEIASPYPYRLVEAEVLEESSPLGFVEESCRSRIRDAISARTRNEASGGDKLPLGMMVDALIQCLPLSPGTRQKLFSEVDIETRAEEALREHGRLG